MGAWPQPCVRSGGTREPHRRHCRWAPYCPCRAGRGLQRKPAPGHPSCSPGTSGHQESCSAVCTHRDACPPGKPCEIWPGLGYTPIKVLASECGWGRAVLGLIDPHPDGTAGSQTATEVRSIIFGCSQVRADTSSHPAACPPPRDRQSTSYVSAGCQSSPACSTKLWAGSSSGQGRQVSTRTKGLFLPHSASVNQPGDGRPQREEVGPSS